MSKCAEIAFETRNSVSKNDTSKLCRNQKDLYKVNKLTEIEMTENLIVLLEDDNPVEQAIVFPNEDELFEKLQSIVTTQ